MPRLKSNRLTRSLLRVFVLGLLPVVWLASNPTAAQAATQYGESATGQFGIDNGGGLNDFGCTVVGYWVAPGGSTAPYVSFQGACDQGWASDIDNDYLASIACGGVAWTAGANPDDGGFSGSMTGGPASSCSTAQAVICSPTWFSDDHCQTVTFGWGLGAPPAGAPTTECPWGDPAGPLLDAITAVGNNWRQNYSINIAGKIPAGNPATTTDWNVYAIKKDGTVIVNGGVMGNPGKLAGQPISVSGYAELAGTSYPQNLINVVGIGLSHPGVEDRAQGTKNYNWGSGWVGNGGPIGRNDPAICDFYWGEKFSDAPGNDYDEPRGPLGTPGGGPAEPGGGGGPEPTPPAPVADPQEEGCVFEIKDPSTWLSGGMCAVVGLLGGIYDFFTGTGPGTLWAMLGNLFIPDDGYFDAKWAELDGSFDDTAPGQYVAAIDQIAPSGSASAGCSGPAINLNILGTHVDGHPLDACSGAAANVAAVCKLILTVGLVVFGALACLRALGSGLGWSPAVGGD